ncbi:MAG: Fe-S protein assembly chaperone HscA [Bacteroidota bacterium]|nr:Fe-S protein assembly chaperone HscA [Bacteroidota bacterium]
MAKIGVNLSTGSLQKEDIIVGIDLGTTNSLIAIIHPETKKPTVLKEFDHTALVPSIIYFGKAGELKIGNEAKEYLVTEPQNTIFSVKRLMGKSYKDVETSSKYFSYKIIDDGTDNLVKVEIGGKFYTPVELSSFILKALKQRAEHILKTTVEKAVITVPAYFNDAQRQATRDAGKLAGLNVLRIVNEPTAASLAYGIGLNKEEEKIIAVYDLGGGTFDVSILRITSGVFEVLSTNGDTYLGGDDFDNAIINYWIEQAGINEREIINDRSFAQQLRLLAEEAKKHLSFNDFFTATLKQYELNLSKKVFEQLIKPFVNKTIESCKNALRDADLSIELIAEVVMVGGSTRIPLIKESISKFFNKKVHGSLNPDEVVALGAAIQADILAGNNKELLLLDIAPLSLGIETMGGLMDVLIPRNSKIPSKVSRQYTTQKDGQSGIIISVYQGERDLVNHNRKLASFNLSGIPAMPAGFPKVEISFMINADGILVVNAKELRSGAEQSIEVKPQYGLTDEAVEKMLFDSISHASDDIQKRALVEAQTEGKILIDTTKSFVEKNKNYLSKEEINTTTNALRKLERLIESDNKDQIQQMIEELNRLSRPFAERLMDEAIGKAMKGKKI